MSFVEEHPKYKAYKEPPNLHFYDVPNKAWTELESLIAEAGGAEREMLPRIVQMIATKIRAGNVDGGLAYQYIPWVVSKLREKVNDGKFPLFMDCLAILCDEGDLNVCLLDEFLEDNNIGYRAVKYVWSNGVSWEKVEDITEDNIEASGNNTVLCLLPDAKVATTEEELKVIKKEIKEKMKKRNKIFISHRSVDADVADMIKDFLVNTEITNDMIFCSSLPGNDVDERISAEVKDHLKEAAIIILILSKDFYESAYCINEAGVAWYLDDVNAIPFGMPEIQPSSMFGFLNSDYKLRRLDNDDDISYLYDQVHEQLGANPVRYGIVTRETKKLKEKYNKYITSREMSNFFYNENEEEDDDEHNFGDEDEKVELNNKVVMVLKDSGGESTLEELSYKLGMNKKATIRALREAIGEGIIEVIGNSNTRKYRVKS